MENIIWKSSDNSLEIKLQFIVKNELKYTHLGKGWPKHTQCLLYTNGLLKYFETIVKHNKDEDNPIYAYRLVAEKCLKSISNKWVRGEVRLLLNEALLKYNTK
jgi:hypothetical protein